MKITGTHLGILVIALYFGAQACMANEIYINQVGNNTDLTISQDGTDNTVSSLAGGTGKAYLIGNNTSTTYSQTGDRNAVKAYMYAGNGTSNATQTGNDNEAFLDCHGNNCVLDVTQTGDDNYVSAEVGNGGDYDQSITITQDGDDNLAVVEANGDDNTIVIDQDGNNHMVYGYGNTPVTGDRNTLTLTQNGTQYEQAEIAVIGNDNTVDGYQGGSGESNFGRLVLTGDDNNVKMWQGKQIDGTTDSTEGGDHDAYVAIAGNNNVFHSAQTDQAANCCWASHELNAGIIGDDNEVNLSQRKNGAHTMYVDIDGDDNNILAQQNGNQGSTYLDLDIEGNYNLVDVNQHGGGAHSATIDLSSTYGPAYDFSLEQHSSSAKSYTMTGTCANPNGCSVSVTQY
jgi:hypothetical protein